MLDGEAARVVLVNSITLTPGTLCDDLDGDRLILHCLDPKFAESMLFRAAKAGIRRAATGRFAKTSPVARWTGPRSGSKPAMVTPSRLCAGLNGPADGTGAGLDLAALLLALPFALAGLR